MTTYLDSSLIVNAKESETATKQIANPRERALARLLIMQSMCATRLDDARPPETPLDLLYVVEIARALYQNKNLLNEVLNGNPEDYLWDEE